MISNSDGFFYPPLILMLNIFLLPFISFISFTTFESTCKMIKMYNFSVLEVSYFINKKPTLSTINNMLFMFASRVAYSDNIL